MASGHVVAVVERGADGAGFLAEDEQSEDLIDVGEQEELAKCVVVHGAREIKYRWGRDEQGRAASRLWSVKAKGDAAANGGDATRLVWSGPVGAQFRYLDTTGRNFLNEHRCNYLNQRQALLAI